MERLKVASLFCGCGGTDVGVLGDFDFLGKHYDSNHTEIVYANDIEKSACDIFQKNFCLEPDNRDIREVSSTELPDFDILTGGFPCQSFSIVAQNPKRLGIKDEKGMLFFEMCRILKDKQPKCFIAENVKGLLTANKHEAFPLIIKEFEDSGYDVKYQILKASDYGVPQNRERVIIVGFRKDLHVNFKFPAPVTPMDNQKIPLRKVIESSVDDKYYFSQKAVDGMMKNRESMNKGRAQDIDQPCNTVGAHLAKVSLNSTDPVLMEGDRYRRFTPREVARIQSFPESYELVESETAQYRALGNAIPPVMIWYVAREICDILNNIQQAEVAEIDKYSGYQEKYIVPVAI
jgi:DNA (cytosine-5)-methyltransferase 1